MALLALESFSHGLALAALVNTKLPKLWFCCACDGRHEHDATVPSRCARTNPVPRLLAVEAMELQDDAC